MKLVKFKTDPLKGHFAQLYKPQNESHSFYVDYRSVEKDVESAVWVTAFDNHSDRQLQKHKLIVHWTTSLEWSGLVHERWVLATVSEEDNYACRYAVRFPFKRFRSLRPNKVVEKVAREFISKVYGSVVREAEKKV